MFQGNKNDDMNPALGVSLLEIANNSDLVGSEASYFEFDYGDIKKTLSVKRHNLLFFV